MCEEYANLLNKTKDTTMASSKPMSTWKKSIQDYVSTKDFKKELARNIPSFKGCEQHDAHEF